MRTFDFLGRFYSRRWEMVFLLFTGITVVYTLRVNMSVAAQDMRDDLDWSEAEKGYVLSAFYWGYATGQIPASWLIHRYGAKWIFGLSVLIPSILTLLVPLACHHSFGLALFIRCMIGFFESASFPAVYHFFPIWVPLEEKSFMLPAIASGMYFGEIIGFSLSGYLVDWSLYINGQYWGGWQSVFYVFGLAGIVWFPYWAIFAYETPESHPRITKEEVDYIKAGKGYGRLADLRDEEADSKYKNLIVHGADEGTTINNIYGEEGAEGGVGSEGNLGYSQTHRTPSKSSNRSASGNAAGPSSNIITSPSDYYNHYYNSPKIDSITNPLARNSGDKNGGEDGNVRQISHITDEADREEMANRIPYYNFFTHPVSLTLFVNSWTFGFIGFTLLSEMPAYFTDILGFDLASAGVLCVFPYLSLFISSLAFGAIFENLQLNHGWSVDKVRQVSQYIAYAGSTGVLIMCGFMDNKYVAYVFMILTQFLMGAANAGILCAYSDVAPNFSSALNSIGNTIGAVAGIVGPILIAMLTTSMDAVWGWRLSFFITGILAFISLVLWSIYQTSQPVPALNLPARKHLPTY